MADETFEGFLRGQETRLTKQLTTTPNSSETFLAFYLQVVMEIRTNAKHFTPEKNFINVIKICVLLHTMLTIIDCSCIPPLSCNKFKVCYNYTELIVLVKKQSKSVI